MLTKVPLGWDFTSTFFHLTNKPNPLKVIINKKILSEIQTKQLKS
jgi:hypothetical protein